jgi:hypothetical protein
MSSGATQNDAAEVTGVVEGMEATYGDPGIQNSVTGREGDTFRAKYFSKGDDEKKVRLLQEYHQFLKTSNIPSIYSPSEADVNVLLRKDSEKQLLNFEGFLQNFFNLNDPVHQKLVRDIYPNFFERRLEVIREQLSLQEKLARLKLLGPQTKEDIYFLYGIFNGDIPIPNKTVFDTTADSPDERRQNYVRGILNVKKWTGDAVGTYRRVGDPAFKLFEPAGGINKGYVGGLADLSNYFNNYARSSQMGGPGMTESFAQKMFGSTHTPGRQPNYQ